MSFMNYAAIKYLDISNGPGIRLSLFVSGCRIHCKGCWNKDLWDYSYGSLFTDEVITSIIDVLSNPIYTGLSILGGEPLDPKNQCEVSKLISRVRKELPNRNIWLWTGYDFDKIPKTKYLDSIMSNLNTIVVGPYIEDLSDISLKFRGSSNQKIINLPIN